jgi:hypothetical protein
MPRGPKRVFRAKSRAFLLDIRGDNRREKMDAIAAAGRRGSRLCGRGRVGGELNPILYSAYGYLTENYYIILNNQESKDHFKSRRLK